MFSYPQLNHVKPLNKTCQSLATVTFQIEIFHEFNQLFSLLYRHADVCAHTRTLTHKHTHTLYFSDKYSIHYSNFSNCICPKRVSSLHQLNLRTQENCFLGYLLWSSFYQLLKIRSLLYISSELIYKIELKVITTKELKQRE